MINMYQDDEQRKGKMPRTNKMSSRAFCIVAALVVLTTSSIMVQMEQYSYVNYTPSHGMAMLRASEGNEVMAERKMAMKRSAKMMMREEVLDALDESMKDISENADAVKQMLVHHGQLSLQVWKGELQGLSEMVETLVTKENHGYVESRSSSSLGYSESNKRLVMNVKIRIKSQFFHETVSSIQKLVGQERVASLDISSEDVTDSYIDASARADTLDASRKALQTLLKSATNISEILEVQRELNKMNQQYESSQKRAMHLKKEADYSALEIHWEEKIRHEETNDDWTPSRSFFLAWSHLHELCTMVLDIMIYASVWVVPLLVVFLCVSFCTKKNI